MTHTPETILRPSQARADDILEAIGESPSAAPEPLEIPPFSCVSPSRRSPKPQLRLPTVAAVEALIGCGLLAPAQLPLLEWVEVAPDFQVRGNRLRWHRTMRCIVYQSPSGGFHRLGRIERALKLGGDEIPWMPASSCSPTLAGPGSASSAGSGQASGGDSSDVLPHGCDRLQKFSMELGCMIWVAEHMIIDWDGPPAPPPPRDAPLIPTGCWQAHAAYGSYYLIDLSTGRRPTFTDINGALAAAASALLGEASFRWIPSTIPEHVIATSPHTVSDQLSLDEEW